MTFRITGLDPAPFRQFFGQPDETLRAAGVIRYVVAPNSGFPDRVELRDAPPGSSVLLLNYVHQPAATPYRASHAVFVREGADVRFDAVDDVPPALRSRILSLRGFDEAHLMVAGELVDGKGAGDMIETIFSDPEVAYIHAHFARRGCFAAQIDRAEVESRCLLSKRPSTQTP